MKYYYEILIAIVIVLAILAFVFKHAIIALGGCAIFFIGSIIEYYINRNKST